MFQFNRTCHSSNSKCSRRSITLGLAITTILIRYTVRYSPLKSTIFVFKRPYIFAGIYQNKIDINTGNSLTPAELIFTGTLPDNSSARPEGPHVYHINSTYYLLIAEGNHHPQHASARSAQGAFYRWFKP